MIIHTLNLVYLYLSITQIARSANNPTHNPSNNGTISPTNNVITITTNTSTIPLTTNDERMDVNDSAHGWNDSLWYIIGVVLFAVICVFCAIEIWVIYSKKKYGSGKDYSDVVHTMNRQSTSLQTNQLNKYNGNNKKHMKAVSNTIEGDIDLIKTYNINEHHYKSSESKFCNNISSAVKCDEMMLTDIHNQMETTSGTHGIRGDEIVNNNNNISGKTFNNNLVNVVIGNNIMMNDIINEMETKKSDFDTIDEMGMVNISKISTNYSEIDSSHSYKPRINK